jgi:integrase
MPLDLITVPTVAAKRLATDRHLHTPSLVVRRSRRLMRPCPPHRRQVGPLRQLCASIKCGRGGFVVKIVSGEKGTLPRTTYPTAEQVDPLVSHASPMPGRMIRFLAETGMRQEEVCSLEWSQVSIQRREIRLTKTKTSSTRVVPLSDEALRTITGTPRRATAPYVFWHHDGKRYSTFANIFAVIARRADIPFRYHDLCATPSPVGSYRPLAISQPFKRSSVTVRFR